MSAVVFAAAVTGFFTAAVAICGQWISSRTALKVKNLEILYVRKADSYKEVLQRAWEFGASPEDEAKFLALRSSIYAALIVAPKDVGDALDNNPRANLHMTAALLRTTAAGQPDDVPRVQMNEWRGAMERLKTAIGADMAGFSESPRMRRFLRL